MLAENQYHTPDTASPKLPLDVGVLNRIRETAAATRCAGKLDLFHACDLLELDDDRAAGAFIIALVRTLPQVLSRYPQIRGVGTPPSFDEIWLLRVLERAIDGDDDSLAFLILSRVPNVYRHRFLFLVNGLAARLSQS